ncbi:inositol monophosphatase [Gammaproteobacteria bacterium]|nr:inositol monophosphatase [Gammaproteobacteria bacterium]
MNSLAMQNNVFKIIRGCCKHILQAYDKMHSSFLSHDKRQRFSQKIDAEIQQQIIEKLSQTYKGHHFVAEEPSEESSQTMIDEEHVWVIDPIDGSHNFSQNLPMFTISICYFLDGEPQIAWVYDPINDEFFSAISQYGATLNQRRIRVSPHKTLSDSLGATEVQHSTVLHPILSKDENLAHRKLGSVALSLCYLAAGRFDWVACESPRIWDYSAALLIAQEAGAVASEESIEGYEILVAANHSIHQALVE